MELTFIFTNGKVAVLPIIGTQWCLVICGPAPQPGLGAVPAVVSGVGVVSWRHSVVAGHITPILAGEAALSGAGIPSVLQARLGLARHLAAQGRDPGEDVWRGGFKNSSGYSTFK